MLGHDPFYNSTIRNATAAFGSLFNDISIVRTKGSKTQTVKVPLVYSSSDKAFSRKSEDPDLNYNMMGQFPKMAFFLNGLSYDPDRKISNVQFAERNGLVAAAGAPYILEFDLYIATANIEDGIQIVEQIIPFFNPEFTLSMTMLPTLELRNDIPIILNSVSYIDPGVDSEYSDYRIIEWTLNFSVKTFFYGPVLSKKEIKHSTMKIFDQLPFNYEKTNISSDVNPDTANQTDTHTITTTITQNV